MILVDIYVPAVDREYNFSLNENIRISVLIEEISEMIGQKEQTVLSGDTSEITLASEEKEQILSEGMTLAECDVHTGDRLILV